MITVDDIRENMAFDRVHVCGRAIFPDDPMVACPYNGKIGARIQKVVKGDDLMATVRRWDSMGRIIDRISPYNF